MVWKIIISLIFSVIAISLLIIYWFFPSNVSEFTVSSLNNNFSITNSSMQFYPNMRFPDSKISYKINNECSLKRQNDMHEAFGIIENKTLLDFYSSDNEQISVRCSNQNRIHGGLFIAGEGGPTKIIDAENFNIILHGEILLIEDSKCPSPNVAIHELFHVLGFNHSNNKANIMYFVSNCRQTIGEDQIKLLNELYSFSSYPDLMFEDASAILHGRYLDLNVTARNLGFRDSGSAEIKISADGKLIKEFALEKMEMGSARKLMMTNINAGKTNMEEIEIFIDYQGNELKKENNKIILKIKNN